MDDFLTPFRRQPRAEFAARLYERINEPLSTESSTHTRPALVRWSPVLVSVGALALLILVFTFPPAQAAAQGFLDLFRVKRFTAVTIDPARMEQIRSSNIDFESLVGSSVQKVKDPGQPPRAADAEEASRLAGFHVRTPSALPSGAHLSQIYVQGEGIVRVTADTAKLQSLLDLLQIKDVKAPQQLNGKTVTLRKPPTVVMNYSTGREPLSFIQARSPEVELPAGVNLSELGEIGLRIVGLNASEAHQFAQRIDWHTTMLVPVPANAASFREVDLRNAKALLITTGGTGGSSVRADNGARQSSLLLWSEGEMVYALEGGPVGPELIDFANSLK